MSSHPWIVLATLLAVTGCGAEPTGEDIGPISLTVISGNGQVVRAGRDTLPQPVRVLAHSAGSQSATVPDVLTCARPLDDGGMEPYMACTETNAKGIASYWFDPGTVASDSVCAEIQADVDGQSATTAVTCSTVEPGPVHRLQFDYGDWACVGDTLDFRDTLERAEDPYGNQIPVAEAREAPDSLLTTGWYDRSTESDASGPAGEGWVHEVPDFSEHGYARFTRTYTNGSTRDYYAVGLRIWTPTRSQSNMAFSSDVYVPEDCP